MTDFQRRVELQKSAKMAAEIDRVFPLDERVKRAIAEVPREIFVPAGFRFHAYRLEALPLGSDQWISSPLTVAKMTQYLMPFGADSVLEIGCGSGYQAAVLSRLFRRVFSVERIEKLVKEAKERFKELGISNINLRYSDGLLGWREFAPYERILFSASVSEVPRAIFEQLSPEWGVLVAPVDKGGVQTITRFVKKGETIEREELDECQFVATRKGTL